MKALAIIINFCVAILLTIVPDGVQAAGIVDILREMAKKGAIIDGIFKPAENGLLGSGDLSTVYKGQFLPFHNMSVGMKFSPIEAINISNNEYEMYTYLEAIDNPGVVGYGIPSIYYYGKWNNWTMLAMTLLDAKFHKTFKARRVDELNAFIAFREFVKIIKYIHSKGIIHGDMSIANMIIRNGQGLIYDFGKATDMAKSTRKQNIANVHKDFQSFIKSMSKITPKVIDIFDCLVKKNEKDRYTNHEIGVTHIMDTMYADGTSNIIFYDQLYNDIIEELEKYGMKRTSFDSFIFGIPDPFRTNRLSRPTVNYAYFENLYVAEIRKARESVQQNVEAKTSNSRSSWLKEKLCGWGEK